MLALNPLTQEKSAVPKYPPFIPGSKSFCRFHSESELLVMAVFDGVSGNLSKYLASYTLRGPRPVRLFTCLGKKFQSWEKVYRIGTTNFSVYSILYDLSSPPIEVLFSTFRDSGSRVFF